MDEAPKGPVINGNPIAQPIPPFEPAPPIGQKPPIQVPIKPIPAPKPIQFPPFEPAPNNPEHKPPVPVPINPIPAPKPIQVSPVVQAPTGPVNNGNSQPPIVTTSTEVEDEEPIGVLRKFRRVITTPAEIGAPSAPISSEGPASNPSPVVPESNLSETNPVQTSTEGVLPLPQTPTGFFGLADSRPLGLILLVLAAAITVMQFRNKGTTETSKSSKKTKWGS